MNNGKVRIYELSRELNLDNKDILAVCEQLNISVKSHSSTITDSEAERIRAAADKYASTPAKTPAPRQASPVSHSDIKSKPPAPVPKKPQILEVRKSAVRPTAPEPPVPPTVPQSPVTQSTPAPTKPTAPPERPAAPIAPVASVPDPGVEMAELPVAPQPPAEVLPPSEPAKPVAPERKVPEVVSPLVEPQLSPPPQRAEVAPEPEAAPVIPTPSPAPKPSLSNRPILKRGKSSDATPTTPKEPREARLPSEGGRPSRPDRERPSSSPGRGDRPTPKSADKPARPQQTFVELKRPRPARAEVEIEVEAAVPDLKAPPTPRLNAPITRANRAAAATAEAVSPASQEVQLQARPTLPRTLKKGKEWEEEEDFSKAAPKTAAKGKRRLQPNIDEEEDLEILLEEDGEESDAPAQISLSLMRPAKPKSSRPATPSKPSTPITQRKKASTSRDRRDRREQDAKVEKPEIIALKGSLTVQELAGLMRVPETEIIRSLFFKGVAATITQTLDAATATIVAEEMGVMVVTEEEQSEAVKTTEMLDAADLENLHRRPPVVTIMGHVDHGKTTLLDSIRKTKVAQGEAGGITQHIGAYHVDVEHAGHTQQVVFLDTPGHEAFTAMRARGARVTDIAILVVAADDGVRPQTVEAISHAKAAEVPIIVAINKVDKPDAQPDRVKQELTEYGLVAEDWGGDTIMVPVSALSGQNLDTLLEMILLVAEVEDLNANPDRPAKGTVIEAHLDKAKGSVATLLVQNGTLRVGDTLVAGPVFGKVRAMVDDRGSRVKEAFPSFAVEVLGLNDVPAAGDEFDVFYDEKEARSVAQARQVKQREARIQRGVSLGSISTLAQEGELKELNLVLKADVQGSMEAIMGSLRQLPQHEVQIQVLYAAPGEITQTDVDLAAASNAVLIGFNTTLAPGARQLADDSGVDVREYNIIYRLLDDIQAAMEGLLEPEMVEESLGQVEVRAVFPVGRGSVAGCYVQQGKVLRNCKVRVRRGNAVLYDGNLDSLKRMKEDSREVNAGYECGIGIDRFNDWKEGDIIEAYQMVAKRRTLSMKA